MRKAIVMGATSGIGYEVAIQLAERGWKVGIAARRENLLNDMVSKYENITDYAVIDVTDPEAEKSLHNLIINMGGLDLYFHSSGIGYQNISLELQKEIATTETNVVGFTRMINFIFHYFENKKDTNGKIAVISSIAGTKGLGAAPAYSSTKRYINHYIECLEQLCRIKNIKNITLHDIRPGFVKTALLDNIEYPMQLDAKNVATEILNKIEQNKKIITVDWKYRILVSLWRLIPRFLWVKLKIYKI